MSEDVDYTLDTLLELDGFIAEIKQGFWIKIEARRVLFGIQKPFGVKYSLTLHNPEGERVLGYDNAHSPPGKSSTDPHDHVHKAAKVKSYDYINAAKLLEDFWNDVHNILKRGD